MRWIRVVTVGALITTQPGQAWSGDEPSPAELHEARERFAEGRRLEEAGDFGEALVIFQRVARVKMTPQVRFHIALCLMHMGKRAEALGSFRLAVEEAGDSAPNVVHEAKQHIATLEPQVAVVTVAVVSPDPNLSVTLDERAITAGVALDVEPGNHRVVLRRAGQTVDERWLTLGAGERTRVELSPQPPQQGVPPPASSVPPTSTAPAVPTTAPTNTATIPPTIVPPNAWNGRQVASLVAFGVAGVGLVGVVTFALLRADRLAKLEAACPSLKMCDRGLESVVSDGKAYAAAVNVFAGLTGAATVAGVVLYVTSLGSSGRRGSQLVDVQVHPMVDHRGGFVTVQGKF